MDFKTNRQESSYYTQENILTYFSEINSVFFMRLHEIYVLLKGKRKHTFLSGKMEN